MTVKEKNKPEIMDLEMDTQGNLEQIMFSHPDGDIEVKISQSCESGIFINISKEGKWALTYLEYDGQIALLNTETREKYFYDLGDYKGEI